MKDLVPFTETQRDFLNDKLPGDWVKTRRLAGRDVSYIEGWRMINEANRVFGFDGWTRETVVISAIGQQQCEIGREKKPGWNVSYLAKVKVEAGGVVREGMGVGHGTDQNLGQAHESAIKEAETDAMKRAFVTFGYRFGLALYDKEQVNVDYAEPTPANTQPHAGSTPAGSAPVSSFGGAPDYRRGLLYANTIPELLEAWKAIPPNVQAHYVELKDSRKQSIQRDDALNKSTHS